MTNKVSSSAMSSTAFKTFSLENSILDVPPQDKIFLYDAEADKKTLAAQPWKNDPHHFKTCKISAVALIKMVIHARSGVPWEIMGLMQGKVIDDALVIMDSFALPVQGTETRVNAAEAANEYMVQYVDASEKVGRKEHVIGWYHSHPGYACWLSGIDVSTQITNQKFQDPFVAVVIDPNRTISAGKVDIGAFRTYPEGYTPPGASANQYQSIPLEKIEDFGVHADQYYSLNVEVFTSSKDTTLLGALWNKYWVNTLSTSPLISNRAYAASQLSDLASKLTKAQTTVSNTRAIVPKPTLKDDKEKGKQSTPEEKKKKEDNQLEKSSRDSRKIAAEAQHGLIAQVLKDILFSLPGRDTPSSSGSSSVNETRTAAEAEADDTKIDVDVEDRIDTEEETKKRVSVLEKVITSAVGIPPSFGFSSPSLSTSTPLPTTATTNTATSKPTPPPSETASEGAPVPSTAGVSEAKEAVEKLEMSEVEDEEEDGEEGEREEAPMDTDTH